MYTFMCPPNSQIVRRYDIILIQEIRDSSGKIMPKFLERVNE